MIDLFIAILIVAVGSFLWVAIPIAGGVGGAILGLLGAIAVVWFAVMVLRSKA